MTEAQAGVRADPSLEHLLGRLDALRDRVQAAVAQRRTSDPEIDDPFRGLYLSANAIDGLLDSPADAALGPNAPAGNVELEDAADAWESAGATLRLRRLSRIFGLDAEDEELLLIALAPDVDPRFERLYAYLQDDVSRRRASIGLALELSGLPPASGVARWRLTPAGRLASSGLLLVEEPDRPMLTRSLRVPDRVTAHVLGADALEPDLLAVLETAHESLPATLGPGRSEALERALEQGIWPIYLREAGLASGIVTASASARALEASTMVVDLTKLLRFAQPDELVGSAIREARLLAAVLVVTHVAEAAGRAPDVVARLAAAPCPVIFVGQGTWDPAWSTAVPLQLDAPTPATGSRGEAWLAALEAVGAEVNGSAERLLDSASAFKLTAPQVGRAARAAHLQARADARTVEPADVQSGARAQNAGGLERLAHRIVPRSTWNDLVMLPDVRAQLGELAGRARHREIVLGEWGVGGSTNRGRGITALFAGESGTGKTLAAEVIASELGLDLYVIDLSTVIDKYIGETEKNLDRIFNEADRINGVLLFDEADAIFGKRSEVRDARDRYANVEVAYLLQRMERFDGLAVLTTNLRSNLDEAFTRRIDAIVDFPMPDDDARLSLWRMHLPERLPQADDLDLEFMARRFRLSGGNIRNICVTAAFFSAEAGRKLSMAELIRATEREYRKLGRLTVEAEFGPYHPLLVPGAEALRMGV